jgi:hypothetical protein
MVLKMLTYIQGCALGGDLYGFQAGVSHYTLRRRGNYRSQARSFFSLKMLAGLTLRGGMTLSEQTKIDRLLRLKGRPGGYNVVCLSYCVLTI